MLPFGCWRRRLHEGRKHGHVPHAGDAAAARTPRPPARRPRPSASPRPSREQPSARLFSCVGAGSSSRGMELATRGPPALKWWEWQVCFAGQVASEPQEKRNKGRGTEAFELQSFKIALKCKFASMPPGESDGGVLYLKRYSTPSWFTVRESCAQLYWDPPDWCILP